MLATVTTNRTKFSVKGQLKLSDAKLLHRIQLNTAHSHRIYMHIYHKEITQISHSKDITATMQKVLVTTSYSPPEDLARSTEVVRTATRICVHALTKELEILHCTQALQIAL